MAHPLAYAAQLGKLEVLSGPGEPFLAQIQVDVVLPRERSSLQVKLASEEAFKAARLTINPNLKNLRFVVQDGKQPGTALVEIRSTQPLPGGFIDTLVELTWAGGRVAREYTLTIPTGQPEKPQPVTSLPETRPPITTAPEATATPSTPSAEQKPTPPASAPAHQGIYKVQRGDTLSEIALRLVGEGVNLNQAMAALYEANKGSFINGSVHLIREGAQIQVPNRSALRTRSSNQALIILAQHDDRNVYSAYARQIGLLTVDNQSAVAASTTAQGSIAAQEKPVAGKAAPADRLQIAPGMAQGGNSADASAEELLAKNKSLSEANERIALLEKNVSDLQRLLDMQNDISAAESQALGEPSEGTPSEPVVAEGDTAAVDVPSETLAEDPEPTVLPDGEVVQEAEPPVVETPVQQDDAFDWTPWLLAGAGGLVVLVVLLLVARARRNLKENDQEDEQDFSEVKPFDDIVVAAKPAPLEPEKPAGLNKSESSDFDLDDVLNDSNNEKPQGKPKNEVTQRIEPVVAPVDPEPVDDIPGLKAESEEASQQAESLSGEVKLDFPEDEPVAETGNPIFDDLDMLEKGAMAAQEELDQIRKQPLPEAQPDGDILAEEAQQPEAETPAEPEQPTVDLDVDVPNPKVDEATQQEVATKLDLAGAYAEIGDSDGAKELLNEIVSKGDADQVRKAKALLASLN